MGDYSKIKDAQKHSVIFDLMEVVLVRKVIVSTADALWDKYGHETINFSGSVMSTLRVMTRIGNSVLGSFHFWQFLYA